MYIKIRIKAYLYVQIIPRRLLSLTTGSLRASRILIMVAQTSYSWLWPWSSPPCIYGAEQIPKAERLWKKPPKLLIGWNLIHWIQQVANGEIEQKVIFSQALSPVASYDDGVAAQADAIAKLRTQAQETHKQAGKKPKLRYPMMPLSSFYLALGHSLEGMGTIVYKKSVIGYQSGSCVAQIAL